MSDSILLLEKNSDNISEDFSNKELRNNKEISFVNSNNEPRLDNTIKELDLNTLYKNSNLNLSVRLSRKTEMLYMRILADIEKERSVFPKYGFFDEKKHAQSEWKKKRLTAEIYELVEKKNQQRFLKYLKKTLPIQHEGFKVVKNSNTTHRKYEKITLFLKLLKIVNSIIITTIFSNFFYLET